MHTYINAYKHAYMHAWRQVAAQSGAQETLGFCVVVATKAAHGLETCCLHITAGCGESAVQGLGGLGDKSLPRGRR